MPDFSDVLELQQRQRAQAGGGQNPRLAAIQQQAAERLNQLLAGDEWATFATLVQGLVDDARGALAQQHELIETAPLAGDALAAAVTVARQLRATIEAYQRVLELPDRVRVQTGAA